MVRVGCQNGEALLSVQDTGPGIAPEHLARLFSSLLPGRGRPAPGDWAWDSTSVACWSRPTGGGSGRSRELGRGSTFTVSLPLTG